MPLGCPLMLKAGERLVCAGFGGLGKVFPNRGDRSPHHHGATAREFRAQSWVFLKRVDIVAGLVLRHGFTVDWDFQAGGPVAEY